MGTALWLMDFWELFQPLWFCFPLVFCSLSRKEVWTHSLSLTLTENYSWVLISETTSLPLLVSLCQSVGALHELSVIICHWLCVLSIGHCLDLSNTEFCIQERLSTFYCCWCGVTLVCILALYFLCIIIYCTLGKYYVNLLSSQRWLLPFRLLSSLFFGLFLTYC